MRGQTAIGVDAALFMFELQSWDTELVDVVLLDGRQMAPNPHKTLPRTELGVDLGRAKIWEHPDELAGSIGCINDLLWIGVKRWAVKGCGEDISVEVDDIGVGRAGRVQSPEEAGRGFRG